MLCHSLRLTAQLHQFAHSLKGSLKDAKRKGIKEVFEDLDPKASASQILHAIRSIVGPKNLKKLKTNTLPYLRRPDEKICTLPNEALEVWISFFKDMEGVERITAAQQRKLWCSSLADLQQTSLSLNAQDLPRLCDLVPALRRINPLKATGPDRMHPSFCKTAPHCLARKIFGQMPKIVTHGQEYLGHIGGFLQPLWKAKGSKEDPSSYSSQATLQKLCTAPSGSPNVPSAGGSSTRTTRRAQASARQFARAHELRFSTCSSNSWRQCGHDLFGPEGGLLQDHSSVGDIGGEVSDPLLAKVCACFGLPDDVLHDLHRHL